MGVEEVTKRATINLPKAITLEEAEELLEYLARELPGIISYRLERNMTLYHDDSEIIKSMGSVSLSGNIRSFKEHGNFDSFEGKPSEYHYSMIDTIGFFVVPGFDLTDYRQGAIGLWDDVRTLISRYFEQKGE